MIIHSSSWIVYFLTFPKPGSMEMVQCLLGKTAELIRSLYCARLCYIKFLCSVGTLKSRVCKFFPASFATTFMISIRSRSERLWLQSETLTNFVKDYLFWPRRHWDNAFMCSIWFLRSIRCLDTNCSKDPWGREREAGTRPDLSDPICRQSNFLVSIRRARRADWKIENNQAGTAGQVCSPFLWWFLSGYCQGRPLMWT